MGNDQLLITMPSTLCSVKVGYTFPGFSDSLHKANIGSYVVNGELLRSKQCAFTYRWSIFKYFSMWRWYGKGFNINIVLYGCLAQNHEFRRVKTLASWVWNCKRITFILSDSFWVLMRLKAVEMEGRISFKNHSCCWRTQFLEAVNFRSHFPVNGLQHTRAHVPVVSFRFFVCFWLDTAQLFNDPGKLTISLYLKINPVWDHYSIFFHIDWFRALGPRCLLETTSGIPPVTIVSCSMFSAVSDSLFYLFLPGQQSKCLPSEQDDLVCNLSNVIPHTIISQCSTWPEVRLDLVSFSFWRVEFGTIHEGGGVQCGGSRSRRRWGRRGGVRIPQVHCMKLS